MGIQLPGWLREAAPIATGQDWPEADETSLRRIADAWDGAAAAIDRAGADGAQALAPALDAVSGIVNDAIAGKWEDVSRSADGLAVMCRKLADACDETAAEVEHTKLSIIAALVALVAEIASLVAAAVPSAGASTAFIPAAEAATQVGIRMLLRRLLATVGRDLALDVLKDTGISGGIQLGQIIDGNRDGFDWGALGKDAYGAAASSLTSSYLSGTHAGRAVADELGAAVNQRFGKDAVDLVTGVVGTHVGEYAKGTLSSTTSDDPPAVTGSLNMN